MDLSKLFRDYFNKFRDFVHQRHKLVLPGFEGLPFLDVAGFFFYRLSEGELQTRARSLAFSFLLALFPSIIFLFTLIPYVPIQDFQNRMLTMLQTLLPASTYEAARTTIEDIILHQNGGLLSFGFFFALFVSADGILAMIKWFNKSFHGKETRPAWRVRVMAIALTIMMAIMVTLAIALIIGSELLFSYIAEKEILVNFFQLFLIHIVRWSILLGLCFTAISLLYYFGPAQKEKMKFISAGSSLATLLIVLTSIGFNFFVTQFGSYNKVYGSIGTLIIILIWLFINSLVLLVGYELNVSIRKAGTRKITPLPLQ
jgi:membrane protein